MGGSATIIHNKRRLPSYSSFQTIISVFGYNICVDKKYNHDLHEGNIYSLWEKNGYFSPQPSIKEPFVIVMPPPNVTGALHLGHALTGTIQDILCRWHRMKGNPTLYLPGVDHAGIATQNVVEKALAKEGKTRHDLGREKFLEAVWEWVEKYGNQIDKQYKKLGVSVDWTRRRFTMDEPYQEAVKEAFKKLQDKGLIYKGTRLVNWCSRCATAISDLENIHKDEKGTLHYLDYGIVKIASTRPETIFADVAVSINPQDKRYQDLVGKHATVPLANRNIPVITSSLVDKDFGTGALKITPAHDETDYEIWQQHGGEITNVPVVISPDGKMAQNKYVPKKYQNLPLERARELVVADLKNAGLIVKEEEIVHSVGHCQRCDTIIEPTLSEQWFVKTKPLAEPAIKAVKDGTIKIIPKRFEKIYFHWMESIKDWCISRQIWWGHKIPIDGETDVLDTWFSSGLWPFATLGWPSRTKGSRGKLSDYERFYPTTVLETGYDILFFWVARMIMLGCAMTGKAPFEVVYLHGMVRDIEGRKMSKSLGNVIDPVELSDKYGADSLRMALVVGSTPGNDMKLSEEKIIGFRNFANKIWNVARFVLTDMDKWTNHLLIHSSTHPDDKWIIEEIRKTTTSITESLEKYRLSDAGQEIYDFIWHKFADIYIEKVKDRRSEAQPTLLYVLQESLKLLHPFMPFVTETIWQMSHNKKHVTINKLFKEEALIIAPWPKQTYA